MPPSGTRVEEASKRGWSESWEAYGTERTWTILDELFEIADKTDKTPAQVALRWLLEQEAVTAPITGVRTMKHLEDNLGATGWSLTDDQLAKLNEVSEPDAPYPY